jgi:hypothetical protein
VKVQIIQTRCDVCDKPLPEGEKDWGQGMDLAYGTPCYAKVRINGTLVRLYVIVKPVDVCEGEANVCASCCEHVVKSAVMGE